MTAMTTAVTSSTTTAVTTAATTAGAAAVTAGTTAAVKAGPIQLRPHASAQRAVMTVATLMSSPASISAARSKFITSPV